MSSRYCFNLTNFSPADRRAVEDLGASDETTYLTYGFTLADDLAETNHLEGFVIFTRARHHSWLKSKISDRINLHSTSPSKCHHARAYCMKDVNFREFGEFPDPPKNKDEVFCMGW
jgi:hypothetical protein